ncbi:MAG: hypothetical protein ACLQVJ_14820 [Syntrophobacteraceae bacterium]
MLNQEDFDFYYLIICSRGPGSETIVVDNVSNRRDALQFYEGAEDQFKRIGACEAGANFNDEGPVIAVPAGTKPLKAMYAWLKNYCDVVDAEYAVGTESTRSTDPETLAILEKLDKKMSETRSAFLSACIRAFLPSKIGSDGNPWTSVNGWRKLEIEVPNRVQFEALMEATGETAEQLGKWDCAVLKEASKRYLEGTLSEREFPGC